MNGYEGTWMSNEKILIDMVHHNPGEFPTNTKFLDPLVLSGLGYTGQVFKHVEAVADYDKIGFNWRTTGSEEAIWAQEIEARIIEQNTKTKNAGLDLYYHVDLIVLPKLLLDNFRNELCDPDTGRISIRRPFTQETLRAMFQNIACKFPEIDGYVIRVGETYTYDTPYHLGNGAVTYQTDGPCKSEVEEFIILLNLLIDEVCKKEKKLIFRTWDCYPNRFHSSADYYLNITSQIEAHPNLIFSIKYTAADFLRRVPPNQCLGIGKHPQIVEVQCQREYEGKGAYPNYIGHDLLDGSAENNNEGGLNQISENTLFNGLFTWSRGGGWYGPYISSEFWCELNVRTVAAWFADTSRNEDAAFSKACGEITGLSSQDIERFHEACLLSSKAVLKGRYVAALDSTKTNSIIPICHWWMRDDVLGGLDQLNPALEYLYDHSLMDEALVEKAESVKLWESIVEIIGSLEFPNKSLGNDILVSAKYGLALFGMVEAGWRVMSYGYRSVRDIVSTQDLLTRAIDDYYLRKTEFTAITEMPGSATRYRGRYFALPGEELPPGLDDTIALFRNKSV